MTTMAEEGSRPWRDPVRELLREALTQRLAAQRQAGHDLRAQGYAYSTMDDFVLQHGVWYAPRTLPRGVRRGAPKACFGNALVAAASRGWRYVEGYALLVPKGVCAGLAFHHAWAVDARDRLYEVTWPTPGLAYLGVTFSVERADDATWAGDATVLDDFRRRWPLLREPWTGEPPLAIWEPSPWLALVQAGRLDEARAWVTAHRHDHLEG